MINTMAFGSDKFKFRKQSLLKAADPLDFAYETWVGGFNIRGTQPDDTNRRVVFAIDDKLYKFGNNGLTEYDDRGELADILENGNTVGELLDVKEIPEFIGKRVYPIIAMDAPFDAPVMPKINLSVDVKTYNDIYTKTFYSPIYKLEFTGNAAKIIKITCDKILSGYATMEIQVRLRNRFNNWQDWIELDAAQYEEATAVQFRVKYILTTLDGSDSIELKTLQIDYTSDVDKNVGDVTEIVTKPQEYFEDFGTCYALLKHAPLGDATVQAFISFRQPAIERRNVPLGTTNGDVQSFPLIFEGEADKNIDPASIHLAVDGIGVYDFQFDTQASTVTLKAKSGRVLTASYNCGIDNEQWRPMALDFTRLDGDHYNSRFVYYLDDFQDKKISAVKFRLTKGQITPDVYGYIVGWTPKI